MQYVPRTFNRPRPYIDTVIISYSEWLVDRINAIMTSRLAI